MASSTFYNFEKMYGRLGAEVFGLKENATTVGQDLLEDYHIFHCYFCRQGQGKWIL
jgi:hypothetical protein